MANSALIKALAATALVCCAMLLAGCGELVEKNRRSSVGFEAFNASTPCADTGGDCKCDGGFVIYGAGADVKDFESDEDFAKWDVYPERLGSDTIPCTTEVMGAPYVFDSSSRVKCRCVKADLKCAQLTEPWANGCGTGSSSKLLHLGMSHDQIKCCNGHDTCYSLCGKAKQQCDDDFDSCLDKTCGGHVCKAKIALMKRAVGTKASDGAYSAAERHDQWWSVPGLQKKEEKKADEALKVFESDEDFAKWDASPAPTTEKKADEDKKEENKADLPLLVAIVAICALLAMVVTVYVVGIPVGTPRNVTGYVAMRPAMLIQVEPVESVESGLRK